MARCLLLVLFLVSTGVEAYPTPIVEFRLKHYPVHGQTVAALKQSMFQNTPVRSEQGTYGGVTENSIETTYDLISTADGGCTVRNPMVRLLSVVTLPKLAEPIASGAVAAEWDRFLGALRAHELIHAQNGRSMANTVLKRLNGVRTQSSCDQVSPRLKHAISKLIDNMGEYDRQIDETTNHGETQGAVLNTRIR